MVCFRDWVLHVCASAYVCVCHVFLAVNSNTCSQTDRPDRGTDCAALLLGVPSPAALSKCSDAMRCVHLSETRVSSGLCAAERRRRVLQERLTLPVVGTSLVLDWEWNLQIVELDEVDRCEENVTHHADPTQRTHSHRYLFRDSSG